MAAHEAQGHAGHSLQGCKAVNRQSAVHNVAATAARHGMTT